MKANRTYGTQKIQELLMDLNRGRITVDEVFSVIEKTIRTLQNDNKQMIEALVDAYLGIIDEPSSLKPVIESVTRKPIEEVINGRDT